MYTERSNNSACGLPRGGESYVVVNVLKINLTYCKLIKMGCNISCNKVSVTDEGKTVEIT